MYLAPTADPPRSPMLRARVDVYECRGGKRSKVSPRGALNLPAARFLQTKRFDPLPKKLSPDSSEYPHRRAVGPRWPSRHVECARRVRPCGQRPCTGPSTDTISARQKFVAESADSSHDEEGAGGRTKLPTSQTCKFSAVPSLFPGGQANAGHDCEGVCCAQCRSEERLPALVKTHHCGVPHPPCVMTTTGGCGAMLPPGHSRPSSYRTTHNNRNE
jgi:hypothetical protein